MGENKEKNEAPLSILEEIINETFQKLENYPDFHQEMVSKLKSLDSDDTLQNESKLIAILRGESQ